MKGRLEIDFVDLQGNVIDRFDERQLILNHAKTCTSKLIGGAPQNTYAIRDIYLGDDVGTGDLNTPEQPQVTYDINDLNVVHQMGLPNVFYPTEESVLFSKTIAGTSIVDSYNTLYALSGETADINSAALITGGIQPLSYKRFPVKVITRFINIEVRWTLEF